VAGISLGTRPEKRYEKKIIEVPGLKSRVLPIVGECQKLSLVLLDSMFRIVHPAKSTGCKHCRCRTAALCGKAGDLVDLSGLGGRLILTRWAKSELSRYKPRCDAFSSNLPRRCNGHSLKAEHGLVRAKPLDAGPCLPPFFWVILRTPIETKVIVTVTQRNEISGSHFRILIIQWSFVYGPWNGANHANFGDKSDWMELLSTTTAEKDGVKARLRIVRIESLPIERYLSRWFGHEGRIYLSGAGDEPVKFERKKCAVSSTTSLRSRFAHD
jgi:hypothetical protein